MQRTLLFLVFTLMTTAIYSQVTYVSKPVVDCTTNEVCVHVEATGLNGATGTTFSIVFDPAIITYDNIVSNLPGSPIINAVDAATGLVRFVWGVASPITWTDGDTIITMKFDIVSTNFPSPLVDLTSVPPTNLTVDFAGTAGTVTFSEGMSSAINDGGPPTLTCPAAINLTIPSGQTSTLITGLAPTALMDDCFLNSIAYNMMGSVNQTGDSVINQLTFPIGTTTVTYTATDLSGNSVNCSYTVTVNNATTTNLTLDLTENTMACNATSTTVKINVLDFDDVSGFNFGITYDDALLNLSAVSFQNLPGTAPTTTMGTGQVDINYSNPSGVMISDNDPIICLEFQPIGGMAGTSAIAFGNPSGGTITFTDGSMMAIPASMVTLLNGSVTVTDGIDPTITCPTNRVIEINGGTGMVVSGLTPSIADNCCIDTVYYNATGALVMSGPDDISNEAFPVGTTNVTYTIEDCNGGDATCSFSVEVIDTSTTSMDTLTLIVQDLTIPCDSSMAYVDIEVENFDGVAGMNFGINWDPTILTLDTIVDYINGSPTVNYDSIGVGEAYLSWSDAMNEVVADGDSIFSLRFNLLGKALDASSIFLSGANTLNPMFTDETGMMLPFKFITGGLTIVDNVAPIIICPADVTAFSNGQGSIAVPGLAPTVSDNCAIDTVFYQTTGATGLSGPDDASNEIFIAGVTNVTYTVEDCAGSMQSCLFMVTVDDMVPTTDTLTLIVEGTSVACDSSMVYVDINVMNFDSVAGMNFGINWDPSILTLDTIVDHIAGSPAVNYDSIGIGEAYLSYSNATNLVVMDGDSILSLRFNLQGKPVPTSLITLSGANGLNPMFTNENGQMLPHIFVNGGLSITDNMAPSIMCPADVTAFSNGQGSVAVTGLAPTSTDNCVVDTVYFQTSGATMLSGPDDASNEIFQAGMTSVTYTVEDCAGNDDMCSFNVTVIDTIPQTDTLTLLVENVTVACDSTMVYVDVNVVNFDSVAGMNFGINWDPAIFALDTIVDHITGTPAVNYDSVGVGEAYLSYSNATDVVVMDGDSILSIRFNLVGKPAQSSAITLSGANGANPMFTNENGELLPFIFVDGSLMISDNVDPTISCPADTTVFSNGLDSIMVAGLAPISSDNCGIDTLFYQTTGDSNLSGANDISNSFFQAGTTNVIYTVEDCAGNTDACSFNVTVIDTIPTMDTLILSVENEQIICDSSMLMLDILADNFTNLAGLNFGIFWDPNALQFDTIFENLPGAPAINLDSVAVGAVYISWSTAMNEFLPDGTAILTLKFNVLANGGSVTNVTLGGAISTTAMVVDENGMMQDFIFNNGIVSITDLEAPSIACPMDLTIDANGNTSANVMGLAPTAMDNCAIDSVHYVLNGVTMGSGLNDASGDYNVGTTTVTYYATDFAGNIDSCSFNVTVENMLVPNPFRIIGDSLDVSCGMDTIKMNFTVENFDTITAISIGFTWNSGVIDFIGFNNGLPSGTAITNIDTVGGTMRFIWTDPTGLTLMDGDTMITLCFANQGILNSSSPVAITSLPGNPPLDITIIDNEGTLSVNEYEFIAGNVNIEDQSPPMIVDCPVDLTVNVDPDTCGTGVQWMNLFAIDDCDPRVDLMRVDTFGDFFTPGTYEIVFAVMDRSGNTDTCRFDYTVESVGPSFLNCPTDTTFMNLDTCGINYTWVEPTILNGCGDVTVTQTHNPGDFFGPGSTTVTYIATDEAGEADTCMFVITVPGGTDPISILCPPDIFANSDPDTCGTNVNFNLPTTMGGCGNSTVVCSHNSGDFFDSGVTVVTCVATDGQGDTDTCRFVIEVLGGNGPDFTFCPGNIFGASMADTCGNFITWIDPTFDGGCGTVNITQTHNPGDFFPTGSTIVEYIITDDLGFSDTCRFTVNVSGDDPPVLVGCPANIFESNMPDTCGANITWIDPTIMGGCGQVDIICNFDSGDFFPVGVTTVECIAIDAAGQTDTCRWVVTVFDTQSPEIITCPRDTTIILMPGDCEVTYMWEDPVVDDNCPNTTILSNIPNPSTFSVGSTVVTINVEDASGNTDQCSFTVTVLDQTAPEILCGNAQVGVDGIIITDGSGIIDSVRTNNCQDVNIFFDVVMASDDCGAITVNQIDTTGFMSGDAFPVGTYDLIFEVVDASGNRDTCTQTIEVLPSAATVDITVSTGSNEICAGDDVTLSVPDVMGTSYEWVFNSTILSTNNDVIISPFSEASVGTYIISIVTPEGCMLTDSVMLVLATNPIEGEVLTSNGPVCEGDDLILTAPGLDGAMYEWTGPNGFMQTTNIPGTTIPTFSNQEVGQYCVTITYDGCGSPTTLCEDVEIIIPTPPIANPDEFGMEQNGEEVTFNVGANDILGNGTNTRVNIIAGNPPGTLQDIGNGVISYDPDDDRFIDPFTLIYEICVMECGIFLCDTSTVTVTPDPSNVCDPFNVVTPNGDDLNQYFVIPCLCLDNCPAGFVRIYNQWGDEVFSSEDYQNDWDGMYNGEPLPDGTYYYILNITSTGLEEQGFITLFR